MAFKFKKIFTLAVLTVLSFSVEGLKLAHKELHSLRGKASHKSFHAHHEEPQIDMEDINEVKAFIEGDQQIKNALSNGQTLSPEAAQRLEDFFENDQVFNNYLDSFDSDPTFPQCYKDLTSHQKRKFITILLSQFSVDIINNDHDTNQKQTAEEAQKIYQILNEDDQLGSEAAQCYRDNTDSLN